MNTPLNLFATPKLTQPIQAYDPTKSVQQNMEGKGTPSAQNIVAAYQTPQAKLQLQPAPAPQQTTQPAPQGKVKPIASTEDLAEAMGYTSPEEEERIRRASVMNQRIMAVGDALRHIGNIANTVRYAPSQQFNSPVEAERQRYLQGKAVRDAANYKYLSYQQAKAAQDAKQRQWEQEFALKGQLTNAQIKSIQDKVEEMKRHNASQEEINAFVAKQRAQYQHDTLEEKKRAAKVAEAQRNRSIGIQGMNAQTNRMRYNLSNAIHEYKKANGGYGGGRGANPYTYPTMNGYVTLGKPLDSNNIAQSGILPEMKKRNIVPKGYGTWEWNSMTASQRNQAIEDAIGNWLSTDPTAPQWMQQHMAAQYYGTPYDPSTMPDYSNGASVGLGSWNSGMPFGAVGGDDEWTDEDEEMLRY